MKHLEIRRPSLLDIDTLQAFFRTVITDTFQKEGIGDLIDDMEEEIKTKNNYLNQDLESGGEDRYFLIALADRKIVGTIEFGPVSDLIKKCTNDELKKLYEVGTVFVHPNYQRQGIGNQLLNVMFATLRKKGIREFCLDSGYQGSQNIWQKKFGEPDYLFKDYWREGKHHMIWRIDLFKEEG